MIQYLLLCDTLIHMVLPYTMQFPICSIWVTKKDGFHYSVAQPKLAAFLLSALNID